LFFADPRNLPRIMPPEIGAKLVAAHLTPVPPNGEVANSARLAGAGSEIVTVVRLLPPLPFRAKWVSLITEFEWNHHFADIQVRGPFRQFHHRHEFAADVRQGIEGTLIRDVIDYEVGFGLLGKLARRLIILGSLERAFRYRQNALEELLSAKG
jgi:ligand-binding SRPBCC domain-containing protein